jgi:serine/threonine-protein kinase
MGEVRLSFDGWIGRAVATKTILRRAGATQATRERFLREARVQGQLEHPSIVPVYDVGTGADGALYFTMRRVKGRTLEDIVTELGKDPEKARTQHPRRRLLTAFVQVCLAVHFAHTRGVVHRDLKPANVMLGDFGEVYVLDWGIAKVMEDAEPTLTAAIGAMNTTTVGALVGTPTYMSPEQLHGENDRVDARSDVYALGLLLFEILALQPLHDPEKITDINDLLGEHDMRPSHRAADVPPELDDLCVQATAYDPAERLPSARALADAVESFLDGDRDQERRRALAAEGARRAEAATARALARDSSETEAQEARVVAVREAMHAIALDAGQTSARAALARLIVEPPARLPPEVVAAQKESTQIAYHRSARVGIWVYLSWIVIIPVVVLLGVRHWPAFWGCTTLTVLGALQAFWLSRQPVIRISGVLLLASCHFATIAMLSSWMGPFVLVPVAAATGTLMFSTQLPRGIRWAPIALGVAASVVPLLLEQLHLFAPGYRFADGMVTLLPRVVNLEPTSTLLALTWVSASYTIIPAVYLGTVGDALTEAQRKLFLQAWHLDRLAADVRQEPARQEPARQEPAPPATPPAAA